jgi:CO/xanthine dehydrogenase FAD-binding subunit
MGEHAATVIEPPDDTHGSSEYRRRLTVTLVSRALAEAGERIQAEASQRRRDST